MHRIYIPFNVNKESSPLSDPLETSPDPDPALPDPSSSTELPVLAGLGPKSTGFISHMKIIDPIVGLTHSSSFHCMALSPVQRYMCPQFSPRPSKLFGSLRAQLEYKVGSGSSTHENCSSGEPRSNPIHMNLDKKSKIQ